MAQGATEDAGKIPMSLALQATLVRAREYASAQSHAQVTLEHLLLSLTEDEEANTVLQACRLDLARLRNDVAAFLGDLADRVPAGSGTPPAISVALTQVLGYATLAAKQGKRQKIDGAIVLAAMIGDGKSMAASFLTAQGLTFQDMVRVLQRTASASVGASQPLQPAPPPDPVSQPLTRPAPDGRDPAPIQASRAESILAAARERIEARTHPPGRTGPPTPAAPVSASAPSAPPEQPVLATLDIPGAGGAPSAPQPISLTLEPSLAGPLEIKPPPSVAVAPPQSTTPLLIDRLATLQQHIEQQKDAAPPTNEQPSRPVSSWAPPPLPTPAANPAQVPRPQPPPAQPQAFRPGQQPFSPPPERRPLPEVPVPAPWADPEMPSSQAQLGPRTGPPRPQPSPAEFASQKSQPIRQSEAPVAQRRGAQAERGNRAAAPDAPRLPPIDVAQITHTVPLRLRVGRQVTVEVKVGRPAMAGLGSGPNPASLRSELVTARAITVRLRPAKPNLAIEALSPETQWDQSNPATGRLTGEAAVWRFTLRPKASGPADILLLISARTVAADGVLADMTVPDMVIEAKVARDWGHIVKRSSVIVGIVVASMVAAEVLRSVVGIDLSAIVRRLLR